MKAVKFQFNRNFGAQAGKTTSVTYNEAEADALRETAYREGFAAGQQNAMQSLEATLKETESTVAGLVARLFEDRETTEARLRREAVLLAQSIASKLAPALMERQPLAEMEALIASCMRDEHDEPRLVIRVPDSMLDEIQARLGDLAEAHGYAGKLILLGETTGGPHDCRVEWADGGATRDVTAMQQLIDETIAQYLQTMHLSKN